MTPIPNRSSSRTSHPRSPKRSAPKTPVPSTASDRARHEVILIGPIRTGKSTLGGILAQRLGLPQVAVDAIRFGYYEQIGYDYDRTRAVSGREGFDGVYRYWKRFELYSVERILAEHADCVVDFGGGHSIYEDDALFE